MPWRSIPWCRFHPMPRCPRSSRHRDACCWSAERTTTVWTCPPKWAVIACQGPWRGRWQQWGQIRCIEKRRGTGRLKVTGCDGDFSRVNVIFRTRDAVHRVHAAYNAKHGAVTALIRRSRRRPSRTRLDGVTDGRLAALPPLQSVVIGRRARRSCELWGESMVRRVVLAEQHHAMPLDGSMEEKLEDDLCGDCGFIALRAVNPFKLWRTYEDFRKTNRA